MLYGLALLLLAQCAGTLLASLLKLPIPGPVLGMALLSLGLLALRRVPHGLKAASDGLLKHMPLFFVPAGVGVVVLQDALRAAWLPLVMAILGSTVLALASTALVMKGLSRLLAGRPS